ncbi:hypothetical protein W911_13815 [Hyphomicrobium nitrativorans NL23]|uniref:Uncharacterized protein n=1 Tax=Hyphomicrobium nitrativorans NL23 TaxID=1029756 RepID=V5SEC5_9HYPH|nr:hypothetical protein [Hyphomicrobium nitrativorans]AHB49246.1 hypothetical protein W911_13815 [Hyphomicrobium nitrativorans NL23]
MNVRSDSAGRLSAVAAGFVAWAAVFVVIYGMQAVGCRLAWHEVELFGSISLQRLQQISLYAVGLVVSFVLYRHLSSERRRTPSDATAGFLARVSTYGALAAFAAVAISFAGVLWLSTC